MQSTGLLLQKSPSTSIVKTVQYHSRLKMPSILNNHQYDRNIFLHSHSSLSITPDQSNAYNNKISYYQNAAVRLGKGI